MLHVHTLIRTNWHPHRTNTFSDTMKFDVSQGLVFTRHKRWVNNYRVTAWKVDSWPSKTLCCFFCYGSKFLLFWLFWAAKKSLAFSEGRIILLEFNWKEALEIDTRVRTCSSNLFGLCRGSMPRLVHGTMGIIHDGTAREMWKTRRTTSRGNFCNISELHRTWELDFVTAVYISFISTLSII